MKSKGERKNKIKNNKSILQSEQEGKAGGGRRKGCMFSSQHQLPRYKMSISGCPYLHSLSLSLSLSLSFLSFLFLNPSVFTGVSCHFYLFFIFSLSFTHICFMHNSHSHFLSLSLFLSLFLIFFHFYFQYPVFLFHFSSFFRGLEFNCISIHTCKLLQ